MDVIMIDRRVSLTSLFILFLALMTVAGGSAANLDIKTSVTIVGSSSLDADFIVILNYGNEVNIAQFNDTSKGTPELWLWNFGDECNSTSREKNPLHCYQKPGVYNVSLFVSNKISSSNITKEIIIVEKVLHKSGSSSHYDWRETNLEKSYTGFSSSGSSYDPDKFLKIWSDDLKAFIYILNSSEYTTGNGFNYIGDKNNISIIRLNSDPSHLNLDSPYYTFFIKPEDGSFNCYNEFTIIPGLDEWNYIQANTNIEGIKWMNPDTGFWKNIKTIENSDNMSYSGKIKNFGLYGLFLSPKKPGQNIREVMSEIYTEKTATLETIMFIFLTFVLISGLMGLFHKQFAVDN